MLINSDSGSILRASGLCKAYGSGDAAVQAVDGVDIELNAGEVVAVMGVSGSGKTTLLHLLAGLIHADSGDIGFDGREYASQSDAELTALRCREISVVFQAYNLLPTLTAIDNVALPLLLHGEGRTKSRDKAREALGLVGLEESASRRPPNSLAASSSESLSHERW